MTPDNFKRHAEGRILLLDGAMGTMIQRLNLNEDDYRGGRFASHPFKLMGCNDILCLTMPDAIEDIHDAYLKAGADIITTNSFNANAISLSDYGLHEQEGLVKEINAAAARIARRAAGRHVSSDGRWHPLVAGSVGPTNRAASMSPDVADPAARNVTYDMLFDSYVEQISGLMEGGADIILFETVFDTLNLKAGLDAANHVMAGNGIALPIMISATLSDKSGRILSGQTLEAFVTSVENYDNVVSIGLNCGFGPQEMERHLKHLGALTRHMVSAHPNAGLPDALGRYDVTPDIFAGHMSPVVSRGLVNVAGGCCGTTPDHISALRTVVDLGTPHSPANIRPALRVSGLERLEILPENNFVNVGERCNVAGSRKFLRLIREGKYDDAVRIASVQVSDGAMMIDVNMDDALLDAKEEMIHFIRHIASEPDIAKVPVMVDSSDWEVVVAALKNLQGKSIVNSISLKEGEEAFIMKATRIRQLGAAVIVMAFDEEGQADTYSRKTEICARAYNLLTKKCGFIPEDIIFDVNIMAVATGIDTHARYGVDFIDAVGWVKHNLPGVCTSGGVSNLSFAFRGKNALREAMHAVFLYHAIKAGLDMGIVNAASATVYEDIQPDLRSLIEDVVLARRDNAAEELAAYAAGMVASGSSDVAETREASLPVEDRLRNAVVRGDTRFLQSDLSEAVGVFPSVVDIIEGPLMEGMNRVGELFGEGKMFLPQVVKTARTMKMAVDFLRPLMENGASGEIGKTAGKVLFATVKGDVHDIGKNIVSIVLSCNNYEVIDLGVMVPAEEIVAATLREQPDIVCLSGLITPSLAEMVNVARAMEDAGLEMPLMVGGATTSPLHTALKIAPVYHAPVVHAADASQNPVLAAKLLSLGSAAEYASELAEEQERLRTEYGLRDSGIVPLEMARERGRNVSLEKYSTCVPATPVGEIVTLDLDLHAIAGFINWKMFFNAWKMHGSYLDGFPYDLCETCVMKWRMSLSGEEVAKGEEALKLYRDAVSLLGEYSSQGRFDGKAVFAFYRAYSDGDDIVVGEERFPLLRQQRADSGFRSLADYIKPENAGDDYAGVFCVTAGKSLPADALACKKNGDSYGNLLCMSVADRLAEAASEWLHCEVRRHYWGYAGEENLDKGQMLRGEYAGIRPAMGYPMLPDQLLNRVLTRLLPLSETGVEVTENGAMSPSSTVSGLYISNPSARYFQIGAIGDDQLSDYAGRRGIPESRMREILNASPMNE